MVTPSRVLGWGVVAGAGALLVSCGAIFLGTKKAVEAPPEDYREAGKAVGAATYEGGKKAAHGGVGFVEGLVGAAKKDNPEAAKKLEELKGSAAEGWEKLKDKAGRAVNSGEPQDLNVGPLLPVPQVGAPAATPQISAAPSNVPRAATPNVNLAELISKAQQDPDCNTRLEKLLEAHKRADPKLSDSAAADRALASPGPGC